MMPSLSLKTSSVIMSEEGLPPKEATAKSMGQITSALIGIGLVPGSGFRADGFFPRLHRSHLPAIFGNHRCGNAALGARRSGADPGVMRVFAQTGAGRPPAVRRCGCSSCARFSDGLTGVSSALETFSSNWSAGRLPEKCATL